MGISEAVFVLQVIFALRPRDFDDLIIGKVMVVDFLRLGWLSIHTRKQFFGPCPGGGAKWVFD